MASKIHGKNGAIYLGNFKGGAGAVKLSTQTAWTLQRNRDYVDATSFGDTNKTYLAGLPNVQGTFSGFYNNDTEKDTLLLAATSDSTSIYLYADDTTTPPKLVAYGTGLVDATVSASNADAIRVTGEFRAKDSWTFSG